MVLLGSNGGILGSTSVAEPLDPARLERDARHFAALIESSDDAIVSKDLNGIVRTWNQGAERIFGFTSEEMVGQSIRRIIPDDRQQEEDEVLARIRRGDRVEHYETIRQRKDGTLIPISLTVSPIRDGAGTIVGASKIARDITERKRADEEIQRLFGIAREASQLKDEFLATLSHELRTPLHAIVGYVRLMQLGVLDTDKQRDAVDTLARNAASLSRIVDDVLDVSRIVAGKIRLDVQRVDVPLLIDEVVATVQPAADAKGIHLVTHVDREVGLVSGDPDRLRQVLWNLCSNAVKFTEMGGRVEIRVEQSDRNIGITVRDTGLGIHPDFLPHVFERFRQADSSIARRHGGLGLGLAIARHMVELQGGRIQAFSEGLGHGATFRVDLPALSAALPSDLVDAPSAPAL